jgi:hypothetical protein
MAMGGNDHFFSLLDQAQVIAEFFLEGGYTNYIHDHINIQTMVTLQKPAAGMD